MLKTIIFLLSSYVLTFSQATNVTICTEDVTRNALKLVRIQGCRQQPCIFRMNSIITISQRFLSTDHVKSVVLKSWLSNSTTIHPINITGQGDDCNYVHNRKHKKISCPLKKNHQYWFHVTFRIATTEYFQDGTLHWILADSYTGRPITCFQVNYKISVLDGPLEPVVQHLVGIPTEKYRYWGPPGILPMPSNRDGIYIK